MLSDGVALFKAGEFAAAAKAFGSSLAGLADTPHQQAVALTNRAACHARLGDAAKAEDDSRSAIRASPEYARAYLRLASTLPACHEDAAAAVVAAVALSQQPVNDELRALFKAIADASSTSHGLRIDDVDISRITAVFTTSELHDALRHADLIVLRPGTYKLVPNLSGVALVGVGSVVIMATPLSPHAVFVTSGILQVVNVSLSGRGDAAAACCCEKGTLRLTGCQISDYKEVGLLVAGNSAAYILSCLFQRLTEHAIEVREGASLEAHDCQIQSCRQGVSAYGGARSVKLEGCAILNCSDEGVLFKGSDTNAATKAQSRLLTEPKLPTITAQAEAWGREQRLKLRCFITDCNISHNGNFGISIDSGAQVVVQRCVMIMNDPYSILIQGASDATISACNFTFAGKSSKSKWARNIRAINLSGVHVAINYGGEVQVFSCAFSGSRELGIDDEYFKFGMLGQEFVPGIWSKPPLVLNNHFDCGKDLPSLTMLDTNAQQFSLNHRKLPVSTESLIAGSLSRIGWTFQQAGWSPTSREYYAIGNTLGYDLMGGSVASASIPASATRILLAGCGDPRNLLTTVAAAPRGGLLDFVLNDGNVSMLARDAVLLHLMVTASAETVLAVWADHGLCTAHAAALRASCNALADEPWPDWLHATSGFEGGASRTTAEAPVREMCRAWTNCSITMAQLLQARDHVQMIPSVAKNSLRLSLEAVGSKDSQIQTEVKAYMRSGSLAKPPFHSPNFTLLHSPSLQYCLYYSSSILRALPLADAPKNTPLAVRLLTSLAPQVKAMASRLNSGTLKVSLVHGDILVVGACETTDVHFDFIDCSNVADYVSVTSLLQICAPLLSREPHARLRMESILLYKGASDKAKKTFAQDATGLSADTLASLLGLRFVSSHQLTDGVLRMEWAREGTERRYVSTGALLLDLAPRFSKVLDDGPSEHAPRWNPIGGGPLALAHLLKVSVGPSIARSLLDALIRTASSERAKLFLWELTMHVPRTAPELMAVSLDASDIGIQLMRHHESPMLIAFSRKPLELGFTPFSSVHQLLSSFHWDEISGMATFPLPATLAAKSAMLYVTLCALGREGLEALSVSHQLSDLPRISRATDWRSLDPFAPILDTLPVVDLIGKTETGWKAAVARSPLFVAVDVVIPKDLLKSKEWNVIATVFGCELCIIIKLKQGGDELDSYVVDLPSGVAPGTPARSKMSRSIGLISMKISWATAQPEVDMS
ncbi:MAG: hypothetical protein SGPRY_008870 [Prymnesium sp.]